MVLADDLQDDVTLMATFGLFLLEFAIKEDQLLQLEEDILDEEAKWVALAEDKEEAE